MTPGELSVATCYHEAGHAVVARALGYIVFGVSAMPATATGSAGRCAHEAARTTSSDVAIGLAGPLAEAMALRLDHQAAAKDYAAVAASLATLPPDRRRKILARGLWMARSILDDRWDEVRDLAGQLRRKGFIVMPRKRYVIPIQTGARR